MKTIRAEVSNGLWQRICVSCGYDGAEVRGDLSAIAYQCPQCGQDLYARPPRSYAEMEGIEPLVVAEEPSGDRTSRRKIAHRSHFKRLASWVGGILTRVRSRHNA